MVQSSQGAEWARVQGLKRWKESDARWVLGELARSGLSTKAFAELRGLPVARLYQWCARLRSEGERTPNATRKSGTPGLVEVRLPAARVPMPQPGQVEIELLSGRRLSIPATMALSQVEALVALLEQR